MKSKLLNNLLLSAGIFFSASVLAQAPVADFSVPTNTICSEQSLQFTDLSSNAPTAWSYSINGVATSTAQSPEFTFTTSGTYSVDLEASNATGPSAIFSQTILVNTLPTITVSGSTLVCTGATSTLSALGADTYTWDSGSSTSNFSTYSINPLSNTIYTLVGTSTVTGCSDSSFVSIFAVPLPTISVSNATLCSGTAYTITPSGASTYSYSGGSGVITPTLSGTYTVSGTDALTGCSDSVAVMVTVNSVSLSVSGGSICAGQSFTINPSGASTYTISGGSAVVSPSANTTYTVSGTDAVTGCSDSLAILVGVVASPTIILNNSVICAGNVFTIVPAGASNYTYSSGSNTVAPITNTSYVVTGIDPVTGCAGSKTFSLTVNPTPIITVNSGTICSGDVFTITPSGASTYTISGGSSTVIPTANTNYSVTGTSVDGCISQSAVISSVTISGTKPNITIASPNTSVICNGENAIFTASGATSYTWSSGALTSTLIVSPTVTTLYSVIGMDALSGCSSSSSILQYVMDCTGIKNISSAIQFNLYPNPTNGELNVEATGDMNISVVNTLGVVVLKQHLNSGKNTLNLNEQATGIYFVNLQQNGETKTIRIIKN